MTNTAMFAMIAEDPEFSGYGLALSVNANVKKVWDDHRQLEADATESFGILIGSCKKHADSCQIELITTPSTYDVRSRSHFFLKDPFHQQAANQAFHGSEGCLGYWGTWHTHPEADPSPSIVDIEDWLACIKRNPDRKLYFVIVGTKKTQCFARMEDEFKRLKPRGSIGR